VGVRRGTSLAITGGMGVRRLEDLVAFRLAVEFKLLVYRLLNEHPSAQRDVRYKDQLREAASSVEANLAEGWRRYHARDMAQFVRFALASLEEAKVRIRDGVHRGHFSDRDCQPALVLADRCGAATMALLKALLALRKPGDKPSQRRPKVLRSKVLSSSCGPTVLWSWVLVSESDHRTIGPSDHRTIGRNGP
jgi:four helix bundle protein